MTRIFRRLSCCSTDSLADVISPARPHMPPVSSPPASPVQARAPRRPQNALLLAQVRHWPDRAFLSGRGFSHDQIASMYKEGGESVTHFLCEQENLNNLKIMFSTQQIMSMAINEGARAALEFLSQPDNLHNLQHIDGGTPVLSTKQIVSIASTDDARTVLELLCKDDNLRRNIKRMDCGQLKALAPLLNRHQAWITRHFPRIKSMLGSQLQALAPLLNLHEEWTTTHLRDIKSMYGDQLEGLLPLLNQHKEWTTEHLQDIGSMFGDQLNTLATLLTQHKDWVTEQLDILKTMDGLQLDALIPLLNLHKEWVIENFQVIISMDGDQLDMLPALLSQHETWVTDHLKVLLSMEGDQLEALPPLLNLNKEWTTIHLHSSIRRMDGAQLEALFPLLERHEKWATIHHADVKAMSPKRLLALTGMLDIAPAWTNQHARMLIAIPEEILQNIRTFFETDVQRGLMLNEKDLKNFALGKGGDRAYFFMKMSPESREFVCGVNPFMRNLSGFPLKTTAALETYGVSRSTLDNSQNFDSVLIQAIRNNLVHIPEATFGVEYEMFVPDLPEARRADLRRILRTEKYDYIDDRSLISNGSTKNQVELVSSILNKIEHFQKLQGALAILNDMGAYSNASSGVHIHVGVKQWKAARFFSNNASLPPHLAEWDITDAQGITPFQLRLMKQFCVNMHSMQEEFYLVSRKSKYSMPNEPTSASQGIEQFYKDITAAADVDDLIGIVQPGGRRYNINLESFALHGTIEIRGFTKKHSDAMAVDPNMPLRDIAFLQEVMFATLADAKHFLSSEGKPSPQEQTTPIQPAEGLKPIINRYVRDTFTLSIIHALAQRRSGKRLQTMSLIVKDREHIQSEAIGRVKENNASLLADDEEARRFLDALEGKASWLPTRGSESMPRLVRERSLRSMVSDELLGSTPPG